MTCNLSVVVLTFNEERNLEQCLRSVAGWAAAGCADVTVATGWWSDCDQAAWRPR